EIEIEERDASEVTHMAGRLESGEIARIAITSPGSPAANPAFDVTPAELVTGLITDRGVCAATGEGLEELFRAGRLKA
ncbi:MAG: S-methyl-5-thioribose-1-phosphate isomerase, partial [Roseiarcus sp.]